MKKYILATITLASLVFGLADVASAAGLVARVSLSRQTMTVERYGRVVYTWPVSTARKGYVTPRGAWRPQRIHKMWYSKKYENSPMPYSVFYHGGYAIHGTYAVRHLGSPASHGCVRLAPGNAQAFYSMVQEVGMGNTQVIVAN